MNIALIMAGGIGSRMQSAIPKQFIKIFDKPIIVYTMEKFENHPSIDVIATVCLAGWQDILSNYAKRYNITKLKHIILGSNVRQASVKQGLIELQKYYNKDDIILIHDAARPNVSKEIIDDCIKITKQKGNAIACIDCKDAMLEMLDQYSSNSSYPREKLKRVQTPQGFKLGSIVNTYNKANKIGIINSTASCSLMTEIGEKVYFAKGSETNIKLTTTEDLELLKIILSDCKNKQISK